MNSSATTSAVVMLAGAITIGWIVGGGAFADEKKEVYKPTTGVRTLLETPLPGVEGRQITVLHGTFPAGWTGGKHYHTGPVYVYVLEGDFTIDEVGKPRRTIRAGELYEEPIGTPMQARNVSASQPVKVLVFQVHGLREPLAYKAE
ncbi:MAG TPA: cupin domain-containing protein [Methylomirabilota bacterium]